VFHVYTHCVWAAPALFRDEIDRLDFLRRLAQVTAVCGWTCIAYCLMGTHYHLIVAVEDGVLPRAMQRLNYSYAVGFNKRHELKGRVQFRPYGSRRIADEPDLLSCFEYVANNPVEAGLCRSAIDWRWSSYRATVGLAPAQPFVDPTAVLRCLADPPELGIAALREYVELSARSDAPAA